MMREGFSGVVSRRSRVSMDRSMLMEPAVREGVTNSSRANSRNSTSRYTARKAPYRLWAVICIRERMPKTPAKAAMNSSRLTPATIRGRDRPRLCTVISLFKIGLFIRDHSSSSVSSWDKRIRSSPCPVSCMKIASREPFSLEKLRTGRPASTIRLRSSVSFFWLPL